MLEIAIPGSDTLHLDHLVADFNGTLAVDGALLPGVADALRNLATRLTLHVVTADTFGSARDALVGLPVILSVLSGGSHDVAKRRYVEQLDARRCVAIGNGRNDRLLLAAAALGIAVVQGEGAATQTLIAADVAAPEFADLLDRPDHRRRELEADARGEVLAVGHPDLVDRDRTAELAAQRLGDGARRPAAWLLAAQPAGHGGLVVAEGEAAFGADHVDPAGQARVGAAGVLD